MKNVKKLLLIILCITFICTNITPAQAADLSGYTMAISCRFDGDASPFQGNLATVQHGGKFSLIDKTGNVVVDFVYDDGIFANYPDPATGMAGNHYIVIQDGKWGVIDRTGKPVISCVYDSIRLGGGLAAVGKGEPTRPGPGAINGEWGLIDLGTGQEILPVKYRIILPSTGYSQFIVFQGKPVEYRAGVIDRSGKFVIPPQYDNIQPTNDGQLYIVYLGNKTGLFDNTGRNIVPLGTYDYIESYASGLAIVGRKGKYGVIDTFGKVVIPVTYGRIELRSGKAVVAMNGKYGVINISGKQIIPFDYDYGGYTENGAIFMRKKSKTTIFDRSGTMIAPAGMFDSAYIGAGYIGNLVFVERKGKIGAIDMTGRQVIPPVYTGVRETKKGLAVFTANDKCAVINQDGKIILPLNRYGNINLLDDGNILVVSAATGRWGLTGHGGETILPCDYWGIGHTGNNYVVANNEKGCAVFDIDGNIVVPFGEFDYIDYRINENMIAVTKNGLTGYISLPEYVEKPDSWAKAEVDRAIAAGLVPADMQKDYRENITRADFCRLAVNLIEIKTGMKVDAFMETRGMSGRVSAPKSFTDTTAPYVIAASRLGIVSGVGNNRFNPTGSITRQDAAVMLQRTAEVLDFSDSNGTSVSFADSSKFSDYAVKAIAFVSATADKESGNRVMGGTGNNKFSPFSPYTRQQAYVTMLRLFNALQ